MEDREAKIKEATEIMTTMLIQRIGSLNGVNIEPSDIDEETVIMLAEQIRVNALPAIEYAKARQADDAGKQARHDERKNGVSGDT